MPMARRIRCTDENRRNLVERYLLGGMQGREKAAFAEHLSQCEACKAELQKSQAMLDDLQQAARDAGWRKEDIERLSQLYAGQEYLTKINWRLVAIISGALFLLVLPFIWWAHKPETQMRLWVKLEPDAHLEAATSAAADPFRPALDALQEGEYEQAVQLLQAVSAARLSVEEQGRRERLLGLAYLLGEAPEPAIIHLQKALALLPAAEREPCLWYLANGYLLLGDREFAGRYLRETGTLQGRHAKQARRLQVRLQKLFE